MNKSITTPYTASKGGILTQIIFVILAMLCSTGEAKADILYNPEMPLLTKEFIVEVATINDRMNDHEGIPLTEATGHVYIPAKYYSHDGRSHGMFIVCTLQGVGHYAAFDTRCPKCHYRDHKKGDFVFIDAITAQCNRCGTYADHLTWHGIGQCQQQDGDELLELYYLDSYLTDAFKKNGKWYVRIYNNPITTKKPDPQYELPKPTEPFRYPGT